jgi:hypothetical protein
MEQSCRWTRARTLSAGTHSAELLGIAATGPAVELTSTAFLRIENGMIAEAWDVEDSTGLLAQLGALPGGVRPHSCFGRRCRLCE